MVARTYRTEGIVLRSFPTGEGGLIVALLQSDGAKLRAMAWGARKLTSRKIGHLEPLTRVEASFSRGRGMDNGYARQFFSGWKFNIGILTIKNNN